jgi:hypothetical protein
MKSANKSAPLKPTKTKTVVSIKPGAKKHGFLAPDFPAGDLAAARAELVEIRAPQPPAPPTVGAVRRMFADEPGGIRWEVIRLVEYSLDHGTPGQVECLLLSLEAGARVIRAAFQGRVVSGPAGVTIGSFCRSLSGSALFSAASNQTDIGRSCPIVTNSHQVVTELNYTKDNILSAIFSSVTTCVVLLLHCISLTRMCR